MSQGHGVRRPLTVHVNGHRHELTLPGATLLSDVLRTELGLTGTKVGCGTGDCGTCTVLIDGDALCACLAPIGRLDGCRVTTVEGLADDPLGARLQRSFLRHAATQCGFCTPGMLLAAQALLLRNPCPTIADIERALGGVLCRCTGYRAIVRAVADIDTEFEPEAPPPGKAVGAALPRVDGLSKVTGEDVFGADGIPADALVLKAVRSPYPRARFTFGDLTRYRFERHGVELVLTAADVPGINRHGVLPAFADQPVFAEGEVRFAGEAVAAVVFDAHADASVDDFPVVWEPLPPVVGIEDALRPGAPAVHGQRAGNVLVRGHAVCGDVDDAFATCDVVADARFDTPFVEHAYLEPEAGWAEVVDGVVVIRASTQAPYMDRDATAAVLGVDPQRVHVRPTAVGGGFGGKLDLSIEPYVGLAALLLGRPVGMVYDRRESMAVTTKRHPASLHARIGADRNGRLRGVELTAIFDTGAYASWGPTVANRVPVHGSGPYHLEHYRADSVAVHTNVCPSGAFRGFGVPQVAIAVESVIDDVARAIGVDPLELRLRNALDRGQSTVTGQRLQGGVGIRDCLIALRQPWADARAMLARTPSDGRLLHGAGIAAIWYGCGNTAMTNPSTIKAAIRSDGSVVLHQGAIDLGQGANTVLTQIFADALGVDVKTVTRAPADTDQTPDAGKSSASRQTFVSGRAALLAGEALRGQLLMLAGLTGQGGGTDAEIEIEGASVRCRAGGVDRRIDLGALPVDEDGYVLRAVETYDPPTTALDAQGQGSPYAVYTFGAQLVELTVDTGTGQVSLRQVTAAYDVGRAVNPQLVAGQLEGGIAQGIGLALLEDYIPGRTDNLHDYLIPTIGDVPPIRTILIESGDPEGPYGAKGIGEPALIGTAPAILNAIHDACGVRITTLPATPERVLAALRAGR